MAILTKDNDSISRRDFLKKSGKSAAAFALATSIPGTFIKRDLPFDTIIKNGTIYDGTMADHYVADIGIINGKIAQIGCLTGNAVATIDASGLIITPGFIDVHTHCDLPMMGIQEGFTNLPFLPPKLRENGCLETVFTNALLLAVPAFRLNLNYLHQGVTTIVTGNCGLGYSNTDEWLNTVFWNRIAGTNIAHLVPHGMVRSELFGENQPGELTSAQLDQMKAKIAENMEMGAIGMSTGLEYAPGFLANTREIIELCKVVRQYGGIYTTHMRDYSGNLLKNGKFGLESALEEAIDIARHAEIPAELSHLKLLPPHSMSSGQIIDIIEQGKYEGLQIHADQYPYTAGYTAISYFLPIEMLDTTGVKKEYKTPEGREQIKAVINEVFLLTPPDKIYVSLCMNHLTFSGKNLVEITDMVPIYETPADAYTDLVCLDTVPYGFFFTQSIDVVRDLMVPEFMITASDGTTVPKGIGTVHPRFFGTFPKKIRQFVLEEDVIGLKQAIRSMTSLPAEAFHFTNRGKIQKGYCADITIIDLDTIADTATYEDPDQYPAGIEYVLVNGKMAICKGKRTRLKSGKILTNT